MLMYFPHIALVIHYTNKLPYLFLEVGGFIFYFILYIYTGFTPSCVTQKPKYSILVCLQK